ncbi:MAG: Cna B-type domain-containing protein, partial [Sulfitobacter sp.]|nr:Cna B-type domain-containing protein [Sulfitobacter sp.]
QTNVTDASGNYSFTNVPPGDYVVVETDPAGYSSTEDSDGGNDNQIAITLSADSASTGNDFLDTLPGTVEGSVFIDDNGDGVVDPADTNGIAGVTVVLVDTNGTPVATNVTDSTGAYSFTNVPPGDYTVVEADPSGYTSTTDTDGGTDSSVDVTVSSGSTETADFYDTEPADITGSVFNDENGDGIFDPADTNGIAGVTVVLTDSVGTPIATNVTDSTGAYSFTNVPPGDYVVVETDPSGYISTEDIDGGNDNEIAVTIPSGVDSTGNDFLDTELGTVSGSVITDINGDGIVDPADTNGIAGVTVVLVDDSGTPVATNVTDSTGGYSFTNVPPGDYTVEETDPSGLISTTDTDGGTDNTVGVTVTSGSDETADFYDTEPTEVSGSVLVDEDGDGIFDPADTNGIGGVTVTLTDTNGTPVDTTTTNPDG